jgi:tetratricopeptide (TPR) repeat protein
MKTVLRHIAALTVLLGILEWVIPLLGQSIEPNVPIRPHEAENMNDLSDWGRDRAETLSPPMPSGVVSIRQFAHKPPKAAVKEYELGMRDLRYGQRSEAMQHFRAALLRDPNYAEANAHVAELYLQVGEPSLALSHLNRALATYPNSQPLQSNKAWALLSLKRPEEAEQAARRAVDLAPGLVTAHYLLAVALLQQNRATPETVKHLEIAIGEYPELLEGLAWARERVASQSVAK